MLLTACMSRINYIRTCTYCSSPVAEWLYANFVYQVLLSPASLTAWWRQERHLGKTAPEKSHFTRANSEPSSEAQHDFIIRTHIAQSTCTGHSPATAPLSLSLSSVSLDQPRWPPHPLVHPH